MHRFDQIERESNVERDIAQSFLFYRDSVSVLEHLNLISQQTYSAWIIIFSLITIASQTQPSQTQNGSMILKIPRITRLGLNSDLIGQNEIVETVKGYLDNYSCTKRNEGVS